MAWTWKWFRRRRAEQLALSEPAPEPTAELAPPAAELLAPKSSSEPQSPPEISLAPRMPLQASVPLEIAPLLDVAQIQATMEITAQLSPELTSSAVVSSAPAPQLEVQPITTPVPAIEPEIGASASNPVLPAAHTPSNTAVQSEPLESTPDAISTPSALPAAFDLEEAGSRVEARLSYFAPGGYSPYGARSRRLPTASPSAGGFPMSPGAEAVRMIGHRPSRPPRSSGVRAALDPAELSLYFCCREDDPRLDSELTARYLREPDLLAGATRLRNQALENWLAGRPPWNLAEFWARSMAIAANTGGALLLCHNVARSFARGGSAIRWIKTDRGVGEYFDGARTFTARVLHPQGLLRPSAFGSRSIFYLIFAGNVFGTTDPGDWARYFASAALAWNVAANPVVAPCSSSSAFAIQWAAWLASALQRIGVSGGVSVNAWAYTNSASFAELCQYGRSQEANRRAARVQLSGALFGLAQASAAPPAGASWLVPAPDTTGTVIERLDLARNSIGAVQPGTSPPPKTIRQTLLNSLIDAHSTIGPASIQVVCTIEEGIACRFATGNGREPGLQSLAEPLADEIGFAVLEHARNRQACSNSRSQTLRAIPGDANSISAKGMHLAESLAEPDP